MKESPYVMPCRHRSVDGPSGLLLRTLLAVARQRRELDEPRCRLVLDHLRTAAALRAGLHGALEAQGLTELRFFVLVAMFALDPEPATAADLAAHTGVTRSSITDALDGLQTGRLVERERDTTDRRIIYVRLTDAGRAATDRALIDFLRTAGLLARHVDATAQAFAQKLFAGLLEGSARYAPV